MENIRKRFENVANETNSKPPISPKKVPRPVSSAVQNTSSEHGFVKKQAESASEDSILYPAGSPRRVLPSSSKPTTSDISKSENNGELHSMREQILQKRRPSKEGHKSAAISQLVQNFDDGNVYNRQI